MKVLVVGAGGKFAGLVVPALKERGATVRALLRSREKADQVRNAGADEIALGDLGDEASLRAAAEGVEGVFHINPAFAPHEDELGVAMVRAAEASGVRKFVFSGVIHPSLSDLRNHFLKRPVEEALYKSQLNFVILQPAMFMQNLAAGWKQVKEQGAFALPYSTQTKLCLVDYRDVAEAAAIGLTTDRLDYGTFELSAGGMVTREEIAAAMARALGQPVEAKKVPFDAWAEQVGMPPGPMREGMQIMSQDYDQFGFRGGNALVLRAILGREPRQLDAYLRELAAKP